MTDTTRNLLYLLTGGTGALAALLALNVVTGTRMGIADHETLISLTRRVVLWMAAAGFSFVALRPLREVRP